MTFKRPSALMTACLLFMLFLLAGGCSDDKPTEPVPVSSWSPLGSGLNSSVFALTVYDNKLIAGGRFTTAGGESAGKLQPGTAHPGYPSGRDLTTWLEL